MAGNSAATSAHSPVPAGQQRRPSVVLSLVVCVFTVGGFLPIRALWIQLPGTLAAESFGHHEHLLAVCVLSNMVAVVYLVVRHCCRRRRGPSSSSSSAGTDAAAIYVSMTCGLASLGLLSVGRRTSFTTAAVARLLPTWTATTALLTAAGLGAAAASLAAVTYIPFAGRLDRMRSAGGNCICAVLVGDALSSLIPHILALTQGVGSLPGLNRAANNTTPTTQATDAGLAVAEEHRESHVFSSRGNDGVGLRFDGTAYFLSCGGVACVAATCFVALRSFCCRADVYAAAKSSDNDDNVESRDIGRPDSDTSANRPLQVSLPPRRSASSNVVAASASDQTTATKLSPSTSAKEAVAYSDISTELPPTTTTTTVLDDGTERQSRVSLAKTEKPSKNLDVKRASGRNQRRRATITGSPRPDVEAPLTTSTPEAGPDTRLVTRNRRHVKPLRFRYQSIDVPPVAGGRPKLFQLLIVIVMWTSAVVGGPLSTVTSYACYPTGSRSFVAGAVVADVVAALACAVAARATAGRGHVSIVIAMSCLGTIVLIYYSALVLFSLQPQQQPQQLKTRATEMPLFGNTAEMLAAAAWVTVVGVFNFARARIGVECHVAGAGALFVYACAARLGDVIGSTSLIGRINVCRVFNADRH